MDTPIRRFWTIEVKVQYIKLATTPHKIYA